MFLIVREYLFTQLLRSAKPKGSICLLEVSRCCYLALQGSIRFSDEGDRLTDLSHSVTVSETFYPWFYGTHTVFKCKTY